MTDVAREWTNVARVVFPLADVGEVGALYADLTDTAGAWPEDVGIAHRGGILLDAGARVSLGSYFNAFAAAYWAASTAAETVRLRIRTAGDGVVAVHGLRGGHEELFVSRSCTGSGVWELDVPVGGPDAGTSYWLELEAGDADFAVDDATWSIPSVHAGATGTATLGITTFDRTADCLRQLRAVATAELADVVDLVVVVDQGSQKIADEPDFADVAALLGQRLRVVSQPNLGGSGGFARGMTEALADGVSDYVILLDDDAIAEPESIRRAIRFADAASTPTIVGGGMLHVDARSVLYAQSEQWDERIQWVRLRRPGAYDHDFALDGFSRSLVAGAAQHADFAGWWMCLIPLAVIRRIGLPLPFFLKGDDIEFGLRAGARGVPTVSLPGVAVWHLGWGSKTPTDTWEAYFLHRNRTITALLHSPFPRGGLFVLHSFLGDLKLLVRGATRSVFLRALATIDVFDGPDALPPRLATRVGEVRARWADPGSDPAGGRRLASAARSVRLHARLFARWPRLAAEFRSGAGTLVSPESWAAVIDS